MRVGLLPMGISVLLAASSSQAGPSPMQFRKVAETSIAAPGTGPGLVFAALTTDLDHNLLIPKIDQAGRVAFMGILSGAGVVPTNAEGMWAEQNGILQLVARGGQAAPGTATGVLFTGVPSLELPFAPAGAGINIAFRGELAGPGVGITNDEGFWKGGPGNLTLVAREGSTPPGLPGLSFSALDGVANATGHVLLRSTMVRPGVNDTNRDALFTDRSGQLALILRAGDQAPSTEPGTVFGANAPFQVSAFNDNSNLALGTRLAGPAITSSNDEAIYVERGGQFQRILRKGDPAPGAGPGVTFGGSLTNLGLNSIEFNNNGRVAFMINLGGAAPTQTALFSDRTGLLAAVAVPGRQAPGTNFTYSFFGKPLLNGANQIAFSAAFPDNDGDIFTPPPFGVFSDVNGSIVPVVSPHDRTFEGEIITDAQVIGFNSAGQMLLRLQIQSPTFPQGLWLRAVNGAIHQIAATGDRFDVNGDSRDVRQVIRVVPGGMNEAGQVAFRIDFADNSSAHFVASLPCQSISLDVAAFVNALLSEKSDPVTMCRHDVNGDGQVDGLDVQPFIQALAGR